ncbi:MAG: gamma subclass chorismate mutase AroQ [Methylobacter sp.]|nr:MAG: gamma subclass chorismate mutase AroQ [Methylobacter sp.]
MREQCNALMTALRRAIILYVFIMPLAACQCMSVSLMDTDMTKIDNLLILMDERLALAPKVAMAKWNSGAPIDDKVREAQILASVQQHSILLGIAPNVAVDFFQGQMNANKLYQRRLHEQWRGEALPPFAKAPDLAHDVRPVLDELQAKILLALRDTQTIRFSSRAQNYLLDRSKQLIRGDFKGEVRNMAVLSLANLQK